MKLALARTSNHSFFGLLCLCGLVFPLYSCVKQERVVQVTNLSEAPLSTAYMLPLVNVNNASHDELERLPGIGPGLATRIIEHRERYGRFRRSEHLIMVRGLSHRRFQAMRSFVAVE